MILSNQVNLIVNAENGNLHAKIEYLKQLSSREIIMHIKKKIDGVGKPTGKDIIALRRFFSLYLNNSDSQIWQKENHMIELELKDRDVKPTIISADVLTALLTDSKRNYLQLGASAFTKLMLETISI